MDPFFERLIIRAATIDEILSSDFEAIAGQKTETEAAGRRLAAWCRSCANGDWFLFFKRLERDGLAIADVMARFTGVRRNPLASIPPWIEDAIWVDAALSKGIQRPSDYQTQAIAFEQIFEELVHQAEVRLLLNVEEAASNNLAPSAYACLREALSRSLSSLSAPALFERFERTRKDRTLLGQSVPSASKTGTSHYHGFLAQMHEGGLRQLFEERPVLLRLIAVTTRQWIDTWREFLLRLQADKISIFQEILCTDAFSRVEHIGGELSDPHNAGHSVQVIRFEDGSSIMYKPKDVGLDVAWAALVSRLNQFSPPCSLMAVNTISRQGYGWTEFVRHEGCEELDGCRRFFHRAGAWLALFHCFAGTDLHQENIIAAGEHPVPVDLETILQPTSDQQKWSDPEDEAYKAAVETISDSVSMVGLLPSFIRTTSDEIIPIGGMVPQKTAITTLLWDKINTDEMRPTRTTTHRSESPNLPHVGGTYARLSDYRDDFVKGFRDYARYLLSRRQDGTLGDPFKEFIGLRVRRLIRTSRFYFGLIQRLRNYEPMEDGVVWSAQADFVARFSNWDHDADPHWPMQKAERSALLQLNIPHFTTTSDGHDIHDASGILFSTDVTSGIDRGRARLRDLDEQGIEWQLAVIDENTNMLSRLSGHQAKPRLSGEHPSPGKDAIPDHQVFFDEANRIAEELTNRAIRQGGTAAWLGLDQRHSEFAKLVALGPDLYNGHCGIAVFLAAHAGATGRKSSEELALAAVAHIRKNLRSRNAARMARLLGVGGTTGLGAVVYALAVMSRCLGNNHLLVDAHAAAELFTDDLIEADRRLDVMHGSAGAILGLLSLHRQSASTGVLKRAVKSGEHLLAQARRKVNGHRSWLGPGLGDRPLNGMSHGAAGYAYALASLAAATGREEFAEAAVECMAFENSSFDSERSNWPDWHNTGNEQWLAQWCHGATGIGLARLATMKWGAVDHSLLRPDIEKALAGAEQQWPNHTDTLCCGTLGNVEFLRTAGQVISRRDLSDMASRRLLAVLEAASSTGDYRWYGSQRAFNLGLYLGLAGVGYTCLRQFDDLIPNVLIWE